MANKKIQDQRFILTPSPAGISFADRLTGNTAVYRKKGCPRWIFTANATDIDEAVEQLQAMADYICRFPYMCLR